MLLTLGLILLLLFLPVPAAAHSAAQAQRRGHAALLLRLSGAPLPVPVLRLQQVGALASSCVSEMALRSQLPLHLLSASQVRFHPGVRGAPGGPLAVQPGGRAALAPAALLVHADLQTSSASVSEPQRRTGGPPLK